MSSHLSASPKLETLYVKLNDLSPFSDLTVSPPVARTVLPALRIFTFFGKRKYLGDFVSRIDTPQLNYALVFYQGGDISINFDVPRLTKFIDRSEYLKRSMSRHCKIVIEQDHQVLQDIVTLCLGRTIGKRRIPKPGILVCLDTGVEKKFSHLTNILGFMSPILSDVVHFTIDSDNPAYSSQPEGRNDFDWSQLLRQLASLQTLLVFGNVTSLISQALAHVNTRTITEFLPTLQLLC